MNNFAIELQGVRKSYGGRDVLQIPDLRLRSGTITGVIGPSGSGKSTLLRILNLLEAPSAGELVYFGQPVPSSPPSVLALRRRMCLVFQKAVLFDNTVWENISFGLRARRVPQHEIKNRVGSVLKRIGLEQQANQKAKTLSGGEAQRVAMARAVVLQPEILLLDEPTANLDPANVELLENLIRELKHGLGTTVIIVTHNLFQAQRLAEDIIFLYQGKLIEAAPAVKILRDPDDGRTRAFVEGRMIY